MSPNGRYFTPAKTVLLTGAGFTHPFGGYLASEMWSVILNQPEIRQYPKLRKRMLEELNYETLYDTVLASDGYTPVETHAFTKAIRNAYQHMHEIICRDEVKHRSSASGACRSFVERFAGTGGERGFFFTLNQDLFVERFYTTADSLIKIPGLHNPKWFNGQLGSTLEKCDWVRLPEEKRVEEEKAKFWAKSTERFVYIKLHGSYGWETGDSTEMMVMGHAKTKIIQGEALLRWYLSLFKEVLGEPERNLVVIGYGFGDKHINEVIADAIRRCGLRLNVVSPILPQTFRERILPVHAGGAECIPSEEYEHRNIVWEGLFGYYRASVIDFYDASTVALPPRGHAFFRDLGLN